MESEEVEPGDVDEEEEMKDEITLMALCGIFHAETALESAISPDLSVNAAL